jgi:hypothetical protein
LQQAHANGAPTCVLLGRAISLASVHHDAWALAFMAALFRLFPLAILSDLKTTFSS